MDVPARVPPIGQIDLSRNNQHSREREPKKKKKKKEERSL